MKPKVADYKKKVVDEFVKLLDKYPIIGAVNLDNMPTPQLQNMRATLRGKVVLRMTKRRLMKIAIAKSKKPGIEKIEEYLGGMPAILFTEENPFTGEERKQMIKKVLPDVEVVLVPDIHDDEKWAEHVEKFAKFDVVYTGSEHTRKCFDLQGNYEIRMIKENLDIAATEIRKKIKENKDWEALVPEEIREDVSKLKELIK